MNITNIELSRSAIQCSTYQFIMQNCTDRKIQKSCLDFDEVILAIRRRTTKDRKANSIVTKQLF